MKKILKIGISLIVLAVIALLVAPFFIPAETYKNEIISKVKGATGRDLAIDGAMSLRFFPNAGITLEKTSLSNPKGFASANLAEMEKMTLDVELLPLLQKNIHIKRFVLEKPVINLEINSAGKRNWQFSGKFANSGQLAAKEQGSIYRVINDAHAAPEHTEGGISLEGIAFGDVKILGGTLHFTNAQTRAKQTLTGLDAALVGRDLAKPVTLELTAKWNEEKIVADASLASLAKFISGDVTATKLNVKSAPLVFAYEGEAGMEIQSGKIDLRIPSLPRLAQWTGNAFEWKGKTPLAFAAQGNVQCTSQSCNFKNAAITLDDIRGHGSLGVNAAGKLPFIKAALELEGLDLSPYMEAENKQARLSLIRDALAAASHYSVAPINYAPLRAFTAEIDLKSPTLRTPDMEITDVNVTLNVSNAVMKAAISNMKLYGGSGKFYAMVDASNATVDVRANLSNVEAKPLLIALAGIRRFSGTLNAEIAAGGQGNNTQAIMNSLLGNGKIMITDGAIKGVNLARMMRNAGDAFSSAMKNEEQKTDFAELGGSFTIQNGLLSNHDLSMKAPLLRVSGEGTVNLAQQLINYRLEPHIVPSLEGQAAPAVTEEGATPVAQPAGIAVPVIIDGTWDAPRFRPDLQAIVKDALKNPENLKETVKGFKGIIKDTKKSLEEDKQNLADPEALKNLFNNLGR